MGMFFLAELLADFGGRVEKASTWMDEIRSDMKYNYMKPWHFLAFDKNTEEEVLGERNVVTVLNETIFSMKDSSKEKTKQNLLIVIHLIGDLHQPMHVGYNDDKGGNTIRLKYKGSTKILHAIWDGDLIRDGNIIYESCLALNNKLKVNVSSIDVFKWATDSRLLLSDVYNYKNNEIDKNYINNAKPVIEKQLLLAGMRLAYILNTRLK